MNARRIARLSLPVLLLLLVISLPRPDGLSSDGQAMFGVLVFAATAFLLQPIPLGLAGVLVLLLPLLLGVTNIDQTFSSFGNSAVFFLIGAFMIAATIERTPIHKLVSLRILKLSGNSPSALVLMTMISGALLSFIMPEHGVIVLIVPVLMFTVVGMGLVPLRSNLAKGVMIGAAYGCTIGSLATPLGGARNPLTIGFLRSQGIEVDFLRWMVLSLPIVLLSLLLVWIVLIVIFPPEIKDLRKGMAVIEEEVREVPKVRLKDVLIIVVLMSVVLCFVILPSFLEVDLAVIALIGGIAIFLVGGMRWEDVENKIPWGIILLYGGAISMGVHLANSGAAEWLSLEVLKLTSGSVFLSILIVVILTKILTEFMSNTAAVSILLPIGFAVFTSVGLPPEMGAMLVGLSGGLAFMFLISTPGNLISFSSGYFTQKDLLKAGIAANLVTMGVVMLIAYTYWKLIGVW